MKTIRILALAGLCIALAACDKSDNITDHQTGDDMQEIGITLSSTPIQTRSFFDEMADLGDFENKVSTVYVAVYNQQGERIAYKYLTSPTGNFLGSLHNIQIPREHCGKPCRIYAWCNVANGVGQFTTEDDLLKSLYGSSSNAINNNYSENITGSVLKLMPMTSVAAVDLAPYGYKTYVQMELKRSISKIAVQVKVADDFSAKHDGATITVSSMRLKNTAHRAYLFEQPTLAPADELFYTLTGQHDQSEGYSRMLWYVYETEESRNPTIELMCLYDMDGDRTTTDDTNTITFNIPATLTGDIIRNHYYRIDAVIKGVGDYVLDLGFTVKDYETDPIRNLELGSE